MRRHLSHIFLLLFVSLWLASCGGGGGTPAKTTFTSTEVVAGCTGADCSATSGTVNTYAGTGTGVWRIDNTSTAAVVGNINIQNVTAGKTVTLLFSNGQTNTDASSTPSLGTLAAPVAAPSAIATERTNTHSESLHRPDHAHHTQILHANRTTGLELRDRSAKSQLPKTSPAASAAVSKPNNGQLPLAAPVVGDTRLWNENAFTQTNYTTTAKVVCAAGTLGRKVVFWVQTSTYAPVSSTTGIVTDAKLDTYQSQFCGTNNNDGQYAKVANLLGDAWGAVPSKYANTTIADTSTQKQDINIVIINPSTETTWGGYFYSRNNILRATSSTYANSNEALVFFINSRQNTNYISSILIHELMHMVNFYQRGILHDDFHESWLEETSAMMTQDIFDLGFGIPNCLPIVCDIRAYAVSGGNVSYFNWPDSISSAHYNLGGTFGAFLNRRYGPIIAAQLMTDCYTPTTNTSSVACLDFLIRQNGGTGFADEFAKMGASVFGRVGGTSEPTAYGFPVKSGTLTATGNLVGSYAYNLPAFNNWWSSPSTITIPTATSTGTFSYTSQTYKVDTVASGKTSYVRAGVSIPAKTSLVMVVK